MERATYDLIVIGSGPAGEKGAAKAAYFGKKIALVEEPPSYGGAVANTAVPGKAMRERVDRGDVFRARAPSPPPALTRRRLGAFPGGRGEYPRARR